MTNQHPLTDEKTEELELIAPEVIENPEDYAYYLAGIPVSDAIRLAKDWQLEQVMEWLEEHLDENYVWADLSKSFSHLSNPHQYINVDVAAVINDLNQAMRPQEDS